MAQPFTPQSAVTVRVFTQRFSSTPLGARLARHLAAHRLHEWGVPYGSALSDSVASIVAELTANAATHGRVPGRDFELRLGLGPRTLLIDVSDARGGCRPAAGVPAPPPDADGGRGLLLVEALADRWEVRDREPSGKTVHAELDLPPH
ncbi:ATP-binding protein [Streptomyces sp. TRM 70361]|uniref:ATP-binding protein n=1 Tax=Streptomyces sp. TRM 70361 TaxID=3116553 RepID=UPI002E7BB9BA|nr:ATP-binding protein [Streptomyces sp. TRM 70361]MEE1943307.1 ATP-binding protein [Streptomyces sp. TRM 70361]